MRVHMLEGLIEAARHGSLSKASEALHISHTALSKQIRSLEAYYGVRLLVRTASGVVPTAAGSHLIARASDVLMQLEAIHKELAIYRETASYVIGTLPSLSASYMPPRLLVLKEDGLDIKLRIMSTSRELWESLETGTTDGIIAEAIPDRKAAYMRILFQEPYVAVVRSDHPFASSQAISSSQLAGEPLILHPPGCGIRAWVERALAGWGAVPSVVSEVGFGGFIAGMVAAGGGITVLPESAAARLGEPELRTVAFAVPDACRTIVWASHNAASGKRLWPHFRPASP